MFHDICQKLVIVFFEIEKYSLKLNRLRQHLAYADDLVITALAASFQEFERVPHKNRDFELISKKLLYMKSFRSSFNRENILLGEYLL